MAAIKKLILHIGVHKTGSTSIQGFLQRSQEMLLARSRTHVVLAGCSPDGNHAQLASAFREDGLPGAPNAGLQTDIWLEVLRELEKSDADTAIISSEDFCLLEPIGIWLLRDLLQEAGISTQVVVLVREQMDILRSNYVELLKQGVVDCSFDMFLALSSSEFSEIHSLSRFDYERMLEPWLEAFGPGQLKVLQYKPEQDAVQQFLRTAKLTKMLDPRRAPRLNVSPSGTVVAALVLVNQLLSACAHVAPARRTQIAYTAYEEAVRRYGHTGQPLTCQSRWLQAVQQHFQPSNRWLQKRLQVGIKAYSNALVPDGAPATMPVEDMAFWSSFVSNDVQFSRELVLPPQPETETVTAPIQTVAAAAPAKAPPALAGESPAVNPAKVSPDRDWSYALDHPRLRQRVYDRYLQGLDPMSFAMRLLTSLPARRALEIGCDTGSVSLWVATAGLAQQVDAFDASPEAIERAQARAAQNNAENLHYFVTDLNAPVLPDASYDFVFASDRLHRVTDLETLFARIASALTPDGLFFAKDYIGPAHMQFTDEHLRLMNQLLLGLPASYRLDRSRAGAVKQEVRRPTLAAGLTSQTDPSPQEPVLGGSIVQAMRRWFDVEVIPIGMTLAFEVLQGIVHNFDPASDIDNALLDMLMAADEQCVDQVAVQPCYACVVARLKAPLPAAAPAAAPAPARPARKSRPARTSAADAGA